MIERMSGAPAAEPEDADYDPVAEGKRMGERQVGSEAMIDLSRR